jgi:hypothetical protein
MSHLPTHVHIYISGGGIFESVWFTHSDGFAERGGDAEREEVPRRMVQRLHWQRAVRRQRRSFFLPARFTDVVCVRLGLLYVEPTECLDERIKLLFPSFTIPEKKGARQVGSPNL